jgi:polyisoprenoid-binding protein YceI
MRNPRSFLSIVLLLSTLVVAGPVDAAEYQIDPSHSTVGFQVRHMAISKTNGVFDDYSGSFSFEPGKPETWSCEATIQAASINTNSRSWDRTYPRADPYGNRDDHLRSDDFFNVAKFPTLTFQSTGVKMDDDSEGCLKGYLTIHGVTKSVEMDFEILGTATDQWGNDRAGFTATLKINRQDYGLSYNRLLEAGSMVVSDEVEITLEIEGIKNK